MGSLKQLFRVVLLAVVITSEAFAQLASSSWPVFQGNPQNSGSTSIIATGRRLAGTTYSGGGRGGNSAVIGVDGTIYSCVSDGLMAVNPDGSKRWTFSSDEGDATPAIGIDGTIYYGILAYGTSDGTFYAVKPDGTLKWSKPLAPNHYGTTAPTIDASGNIYVAASGRNGSILYSFRADSGQLNWQRSLSTMGTGNALALGQNGNIYVPLSYFGGDGIAAFNSQGTELWRRSLGYSISYGSPAVGPDGTVYMGVLAHYNNEPGKVFAISPTGSIKWSTQVAGGTNGAPAVAPDGTVYVISYGGILSALSSNGDVLWSYVPPGIVEGYFGSPVVDGSGTIYFTGRLPSYQTYLIAMNPDGTERWRTKAPNLEGAPAIGPNGEIYLAAGGATTRFLPYSGTYDDVPPGIAVLQPVTTASYSTDKAILNISGKAADNVGVTNVFWSNSRGGSGACTGLTSWYVNGVSLLPGDNLITVLTTDAVGNIGVATLNVTRAPVLIGGARNLADGSEVYVKDAVVTAVNLESSVSFIESPDRSSGIKLITSQPLTVGQRLEFIGTIRRSDGEYRMDISKLMQTAGGDPLAPVAMGIGTIANDLAESSASYIGLNNTGLLVRTAGKVMETVPAQNIIYIEDGSNRRDGVGPSNGLRIHLPAGTTLPSKGSWVIVTGISRAEKHTLTQQAEVNGRIYPAGTVLYVPAVWARSTDDIVTM